jgi:DNA gyrase/topoisomerase IV subunit A
MAEDEQNPSPPLEHPVHVDNEEEKKRTYRGNAMGGVSGRARPDRGHGRKPGHRRVR